MIHKRTLPDGSIEIRASLGDMTYDLTAPNEAEALAYLDEDLERYKREQVAATVRLANVLALTNHIKASIGARW